MKTHDTHSYSNAPKTSKIKFEVSICKSFLPCLVKVFDSESWRQIHESYGSVEFVFEDSLKNYWLAELGAY